jgi:hypothetical protein
LAKQLHQNSLLSIDETKGVKYARRKKLLRGWENHGSERYSGGEAGWNSKSYA